MKGSERVDCSRLAISIRRLRRRCLVLAIAASVGLALQIAHFRASAPPEGGQYYIHTRPTGALVSWQTQDPFRANLYQPVGRTPGPLHLPARDFSWQLRFQLWGHEVRTEMVSRTGFVADGSGLRFPSQGVLELTPSVPVLIPLIYSLRDAPFLWGSGALLALLLGSALQLGAATRAAARMQLRLELGDVSAGVPIGPYVLESLVGEGGMGRVFRARRADEPAGEVLAIKIVAERFTRDTSYHDRFVREVEICRSLTHPGVVPILDWGETHGQLYLVMEFVPGETLAARLGRRCEVREAVRWGREMSEALRHAHERGVVHRDIKPSNVMVASSGRIKIMDFGIARRSDLTTVTEVGAVLGTPGYIAPEVMQGAGADWRADYYAVGATLYEAIAGAHPYEADTVADLMRRQASEDAVSLRKTRPDVPVEVDALILRLLSRSPHDRAGDGGDVVEAFLRLERSLPSS